MIFSLLESDVREIPPLEIEHSKGCKWECSCMLLFLYLFLPLVVSKPKFTEVILFNSVLSKQL